MTAEILITGTSGLIGFRILLDALATGHKVYFTVRSEAKAEIILSNPEIKILAPGDRLNPVIIPDFTVDGAFDDILKDITHVIHAGSPVTNPAFDPKTEIFEPTVKISAAILASALKSPSVQRVVITSSVVANVGLDPASNIPSAATRGTLPDPIPSEFNDIQEAYVLAKMIEVEASKVFVKKHSPNFTVAHVFPGYIFGRNGLIHDATQMQTANSSNTYFILGMLGGELPFPIPGSYAHIEDVSNLHLRVALLDPSSPDIAKDWGISTEVNFDTIFDHVKKAFPKAVADGIFTRGKIVTLPFPYDSSDTERFLGAPLKSLEIAAVDVASQYLELLGKNKA
ncbi:unnamed protein product [Clonostachys rosea]|uniref:NAD-dependent epimerase/dehydratase domain-containing protein n=1 Tax=Bionectria ochroleuca TaxID=29856 RepID=A0ABY6V197_BIOOC|nr:unnamed protein product [Clonostachys rosea]